MIRGIYVLYDDECGFCSRCAAWLRAQPSHVWVVCLPRSSERIPKLFPGLRELPRAELTVIDDQGGVYLGSNAWIVSLWALRDWRAWSARLASPTLRPMARDIFELVSHNRATISAALGLRGDAAVVQAVKAALPDGRHVRCEDGACAAGHG